MGQPEHQPEPRRLFSRRTFLLDVPAGFQKRVSLGSDVLKSNETRYVAWGEQYNSGYHITGWFLQASLPDESEAFAFASSNPAWLERADWFRVARAEFQCTFPEPITATPRGTPVPAMANGEGQVRATPSAPTPSPKVVILVSDVKAKVAYGEVMIRRGTRLPFVGNDATRVTVRYQGEDVTVPTEATRIEWLPK